MYLKTGFPLLWCLGDNPFLGVAVGDVVLGAEVVEHVSAADAELRFQRVGWVVEACMNDLFYNELCYPRCS
jgi:hypothetical protein